MGQNTATPRIVYLDLLRIVAIFSMMLLHVASVNWYVLPVTSPEWQVLNSYDSLVRFCVPVMFMISGSQLLNLDKDLPFKKLFRNNILRIITAFAFWSLMYTLIYHLWRYRTINPEILLSMTKAFILGHYHLWFLYTLVGLYLIVPFLRKIVESKTLMQYYLVLSLVFAFSMNLVLVFLGDQPVVQGVLTKLSFFFTLGYSGYFVLGTYLHRYDLSSTLRRWIYGLGILSILFTIFGTQYLSIQANQPIEKLYSYLLPTTFLTSAAVFLFFKSHFSNLKLSSTTLQRIQRLSKLTFGMYLFHDFVNLFFRNVLNLTSISVHPILAVPLLSIMVFGLSFVASWILNKIPLINKYFV